MSFLCWLMATLRSFYTMYLMVLDGNYVVTSYLGKRKGKERSVLLESKEKKQKTRNIKLNCGLREDWRILYCTIRYALHLDKVRSAPPSAEQGGNSSHPHFSAFRRNKVRGSSFVCLCVCRYPIIPNCTVIPTFFFFFFQLPATPSSSGHRGCQKKILHLWNHV